ncbi:MAG: XdhC/CoxI family protein [Ktedonobacteraceae bacterium]
MSTITVYNEIQNALQHGERVVIATVVKTIGSAPCEIGKKMLVRADGSINESIAGPQTDGKVVQEALHALSDGRSQIVHVHIDADQGEAVGSCGATLEVLLEVLRPEPRLIIAGAGYVAQALARLSLYLDYRIIVVDDRRDFANPQAFGDKIQLAFGDIPQTIRQLEPNESSWIVIVTRGHTLDKDALRAALESNAAYIGMIGSPSKVKNIFKALLKEGVAPERLAHVHAPIGLDIGAETPDEIALSIAAEMLMLRKKGTGAPLKTTHSLLEEEAMAHAS